MSCSNTGYNFSKAMVDKYRPFLDTIKQIIKDILSEGPIGTNNEHIVFLGSGAMGTVYKIKLGPDLSLALKASPCNCSIEKELIGLTVVQRSKNLNLPHLPVLLDVITYVDDDIVSITDRENFMKKYYKSNITISNDHNCFLLSPIAQYGDLKSLLEKTKLAYLGYPSQRHDSSNENIYKYIKICALKQAVIGIMNFHLASGRPHTDIKYDNFLVFSNDNCDEENICITDDYSTKIPYISFSKTRVLKEGGFKFVEGKRVKQNDEVAQVDVKNMYITIADFGAKIKSSRFASDYYLLFKDIDQTFAMKYLYYISFQKPSFDFDKGTRQDFYNLSSNIGYYKEYEWEELTTQEYAEMALEFLDTLLQNKKIPPKSEPTVCNYDVRNISAIGYTLGKCPPTI